MEKQRRQNEADARRVRQEQEARRAAAKVRSEAEVARRVAERTAELQARAARTLERHRVILGHAIDKTAVRALFKERPASHGWRKGKGAWDQSVQSGVLFSQAMREAEAAQAAAAKTAARAARFPHGGVMTVWTPVRYPGHGRDIGMVESRAGQGPTRDRQSARTSIMRVSTCRRPRAR